MAHDVFISHANEDKTTADMVCAMLEQQGLRCWIAPRDIQPGTDWREAILAAIRASRAIVLVFSQHANASRHIPREVECAIEAGIPLIPFRIDNVQPHGSLEYNLIGVHWLDALVPPIEAHIRRLGDSLRALLAPGAEAVRGDRPTRPSADDMRRPIRRTAFGGKQIGIAIGAAVVLLMALQPWQWLPASGHPSPPPPSVDPKPSNPATPALSPVPLDETRVAELRRLASDRPTDAKPRIELGNRYFDAERYSEAIPWYEAALPLAPGNADLSADLAVAYYYANDFDRALKQTEATLSINPNHVEALLNKGIILAFGRNDINGAKDAWLKVIKVAPDSEEARRARSAIDSLAKH